MRKYTHQSENQPRTLDTNSKVSKQSSICNILQCYTETVQRYESDEEDEILQGKFDTAQRARRHNEGVLQGKLQSNCSDKSVQREVSPNNTGLPDNLKIGIENLSGYSMDDVKVHYNSDKPAQLCALAYTQGVDIHIAPGQEKHLPHEAWHVVQQMQGRVQPTMQMQGININDNEGLEREADVMGKYGMNQRWGNRVIANNSVESKQLKGIADKRRVQSIQYYDMLGTIQQKALTAIVPPGFSNTIQCITFQELNEYYKKNEDMLIQKGITTVSALKAKLKEIIRIKQVKNELLEMHYDTMTIEDVQTLVKTIPNEEAKEYKRYSVKSVYNPTPGMEQPCPYVRTYKYKHGPFPNKIGEIEIVITDTSDLVTNFYEATVTIIYTPPKNLLPPKTKIGFLQTVKSNLIPSISNQRLGLNGWTVDRQNASPYSPKSPFFGYDDKNEVGSKVTEGTETECATMTDKPHPNKLDTFWNPKFETSAIVISSSQKELEGRILANVKWNLLFVQGYKVAYQIYHNSSSVPSEIFISAVIAWNSTIYKEINKKRINKEGQERKLVNLGVIEKFTTSSGEASLFSFDIIEKERVIPLRWYSAEVLPFDKYKNVVFWRDLESFLLKNHINNVEESK